MTPTAVVTGASSGIGRGVAVRLAESGYDLALVGRDRDRLGEVASAVRAQGREVAEIPADLADADADATSAIVEPAVALGGGIDVVVNCAAVIAVEPFEQVSASEFDRHWNVNLRAPFMLTQACLPWLRRSANPSVINVSSASARLVRRGQSLYGTTKAALEHLTRILAAELAADGIRVNAIAPGPVDTPIHASWSADPDEARRWLVDQVPLGRIGTVDDVAGWVVWLVSPGASWTTGAVVRVDGGQVLDPR